MKLGGMFKKAVNALDVVTFGMVGNATAGLLDGTFVNSLLKKAGLMPGEGPDLSGIADAAEAEQKIKLFAEERKRRTEAQFLRTEGQGLKRQAQLTFGTSGQPDTEQSQVASTGRFDTNRLVL